MLKRTLLAVLVVAAAGLGCASEAPERLLDRYVAAANRHDLATLSTLIAEDAAWYLGPDTLGSRAQILKPLEFDEGANTRLRISEVIVRGDTADFELVEENDVLTELGVPALHHYPRFVYRDGLIYRILARRPPLEYEAYGDSVAAFMTWLRTEDPMAYARLWPGGQFTYGRWAGTQMPALVRQWRAR